MHITFRPAQPDDFKFCARLYFAGRDTESLDMPPLVADLRRRWDPAEVRVISTEEADIGWLQTRLGGGELFIVQLFIDPRFQGQGIGTAVMHRIIEEGRQRGHPVTLGVVKTNPAQRLYKRLGFQITHEDDRKFYMRRDLGSVP